MQGLWTRKWWSVRGRRASANIALLPLLASVTECGGKVERDLRENGNAKNAVCPAFCSLRDTCGLSTTHCNEECAWVDETFSAQNPTCYAAQAALLNCLSSDVTRLSCSGDTMEASIAGCPMPDEGVVHCLFTFGGPTMAGFRLRFENGGASTCSRAPSVVELGPTELDRTMPLIDGLQMLMFRIVRDEATIPETFANCQIEKTSSSYAFSVAVRSGATTLQATGSVDLSSMGTATISLRDDLTGVRFESPADAPCVVQVLPIPGRPALPTGLIRAEFHCPALQDTANHLERCGGASGTFAFENCKDA